MMQTVCEKEQHFHRKCNIWSTFSIECSIPGRAVCLYCHREREFWPGSPPPVSRNPLWPYRSRWAPASLPHWVCRPPSSPSSWCCPVPWSGTRPVVGLSCALAVCLKPVEETLTCLPIDQSIERSINRTIDRIMNCITHLAEIHSFSDYIRS